MISKPDLKSIFEALKWKAVELDTILTSLELENEEKLSFDDFIKIMEQLESKLQTIPSDKTDETIDRSDPKDVKEVIDQSKQVIDFIQVL